MLTTSSVVSNKMVVLTFISSLQGVKRFPAETLERMSS
jgi:hypothetical protein